MIPSKEVADSSGLTRQGVYARARSLGLEPHFEKRKRVFTREEAEAIVELGSAARGRGQVSRALTIARLKRCIELLDPNQAEYPDLEEVAKLSSLVHSWAYYRVKTGKEVE